jgi:outer membrane protein assembly factor BamC
MNPVIRALSRALPCSTFVLGAALALGGCSTIDNLMSGDKIDYHSSGGKTTGLEVPPDLTQLTRDSRYQQTQGSSVSAAAFQAAAPLSAQPAAATSGETVAVQATGDLRIERLGNERWLRTSLTPEQIWPQLQTFWKERGFVITTDEPTTGVMETDWAENRGKLPLDLIRSTIGKVFDGAYSTGELDKFRTRVERTPGGTEIYVTHRGMIEVLQGERRENTVWQPRAPDPQLEGEMLSRLMLRLGATEAVAKTATLVATAPGAPGAPARARLLTGLPSAALQVDDGFDRAWRRVGVALDRSGFTVEDRDRTQGVYFVRYIDPKFAGKEEPNFLVKFFSFGKKGDEGSPQRYRVVVKGEAERSTVTVLNGKGEPENGDTGKRITSLLLDDLK